MDQGASRPPVGLARAVHCSTTGTGHGKGKCVSDLEGRVRLDALDLSIGKYTRLRRLLPEGGALVLRADQGLEHGPRVGVDGVARADPEQWLRVVAAGGYSGMILHVGIAERLPRMLAGAVPLVLQLNGKSAIPPEDEALAPLNATVEDAVRLGADAAAYTLYAGSPAQFEDLTQLSQVRQDCVRYGMPLLVYAQPRGSAIERKGGAESLYAIEHAARLAAELGADLIAIDPPAVNAQRDAHAPAPYNALQVTAPDALRRAVAAALGVPVLVGDEGAGEPDAVLERARGAREAGAVGLLHGSGVWMRAATDAVALAKQSRGIFSPE